MVGHPKGWMRGLLIACVVFVQAVLATSKDGVNTNPHKATIGRFQISIHDDRLNLQEAIANQSSLLVDLYTLFYSALWYWDSYDDPTVPPESEQTGNLTQFAQSNLTRDEYNKYSAVLLNASRENAEWLSSKGMPQADFPHPDYVSSYLDAIANMTTQTWYYIHGAYIGVGANSACAAQIDEVLSNKAEYEKMGSSAATTLMALLPTFLAFGNLYVPRSSEAYTTSALVGLTTAFYTLGLPVQSMSAVKQSNSHTLAVFGIAALAMIGALGKASKDGSAEQEENLQDLQDWSSNKSSDDVKAHFVAIKDLAARWERRWHLWHAPALLVAAAQIIIFALAVYPLFQYLGVPKFIFGCDDSLGYTEYGISLCLYSCLLGNATNDSLTYVLAGLACILGSVLGSTRCSATCLGKRVTTSV
ncbi:uncharacterized protein BDR25DRAFT_15889 [Lindgomyces ingoldianus]|uniref:Uncharacterized protein n=1 Tax=Lindgomyces ingoldianus TaxID=673940 RepID=A0ACB6QZZ5_9PLEO|nr:uncharacterized protein BDR25DRAFT_15889 [Lindgomyces ingoldianus]KAF2472614.1 hypothetical protein BDR25DRAFT_15889 [Lindgomyces ingoldianus]